MSVFYPLFYYQTKHLYKHYTTKNKSFLKMWLFLKKLGIKNCDFFLTLTQPELADIDPFDYNNLTEELILKITHEIQINPWYYFREILRIPTEGSLSHFRLSRANLALYWCFFNNVDTIVIIPRQLGKTTSCIALDSYILFFGSTNTTIVMLNKDNENRTNFLNKLRQIRDSLPEYLIHSTPKKDKANTKELYYAALNNKYVSFVAQNDPIKAEALGRGLTTPIQHWDEAAYFRYIDISFNAAVSAMNAAIENAKAKGLPYGIKITTTAGKLNTREGAFVHDNLLCGACRFNEFFYDFKDQEEFLTYVAKNSKTKIVHIEFSFKELGKDEKWFEERTRMIKDADTIKRDFFNIWTYGQERSVLPSWLIEELKKYEQDPKFITNINQYTIKWYIDKETFKINNFIKIPVLLGMDMSENIEGDFSALVFVDGRDLSVIATCMCNDSNTILFANFVAEILKTFPNIILVPERNSVGAPIIDAIILRLEKYGINPVLRIYNKIIQEELDDSSKYIKWQDYLRPNAVPDTPRKYIGFRTTSKTRNDLYKLILKRVVLANYKKLYDKTLITQLLQLRTKNKRIDHITKGHDDLVIAYLLACWLAFYGKNTDMYYQHTPVEYELLEEYEDFEGSLEEDNESLSDSKNIEEIQIEKSYSNLDSTYQHILSQINSLQEELKHTTNDIKRIRILNKIHELTSLLPDEHTINIDTTLMSIKDIEQDTKESDNASYEKLNQWIDALG